MNSIDKQIFSIKCNDKIGGEFIIGNELTKYDSILFKEEKYQYIKITRPMAELFYFKYTEYL